MKINKRLLLILIFAFLIRLIALNQSLWLDEAITAKVIKDFSYLGIINNFSPFDFHPPLFYFLEKFWVGIFGYSEISLRFPSLVFSLLTGYIIFLIGKKIKNESAGILSAMLFLFNPLIVYYSQEARMYMMATFFLTLAVYYLLISIRIRKLINYILFSISILLGFLTFYGSIFLIIPMLFYLLYKKRYKAAMISSTVLAVIILLLSPLLSKQLINSREAFKVAVNWKNVLGTANIKNLLLIPMKFSFGRISFYPKWLYLILAGIWTVYLWFLIIKEGLKNKQFLFLLICPLAIGFFFSIFTPLFQYFRFLFLVPVMCLLLALALYHNHLNLEGLILTIGFLILSFVYLLNPIFHREDWKSLSKSLPVKSKFYMIKASSDPIKYYRNDITVVDLLSIKTSVPSEKKIILTPYVSDLYGLNYQKILKEKGYFKKETKNFRQIYYELWIK